MNQVINRHQLFKYFCDSSGLQKRTVQMVFAGITDEQLAQMYGLRVLRKGYFINQKQ